MAKPLNGGIPPGLDLDANYTLRFTALDPSSGAVVAGVDVSDASLLVDNLGGGDLTSGFADSEPLWVPVPNNLFSTPGGG